MLLQMVVLAAVVTSPSVARAQDPSSLAVISIVPSHLMNQTGDSVTVNITAVDGAGNPWNGRVGWHTKFYNQPSANWASGAVYLSNGSGSFSYIGNNVGEDVITAGAGLDQSNEAVTAINWYNSSEATGEQPYIKFTSNLVGSGRVGTYANFNVQAVNQYGAPWNGYLGWGTCFYGQPSANCAGGTFYVSAGNGSSSYMGYNVGQDTITFGKSLSTGEAVATYVWRPVVDVEPAPTPTISPTPVPSSNPTISPLPGGGLSPTPTPSVAEEPSVVGDTDIEGACYEGPEEGPYIPCIYAPLPAPPLDSRYDFTETDDSLFDSDSSCSNGNQLAVGEGFRDSAASGDFRDDSPADDVADRYVASGDFATGFRRSITAGGLQHQEILSNNSRSSSGAQHAAGDVSIYRKSGGGSGEFRADPRQWYYAEATARITEDGGENNEKGFRGRLKIEAWDRCGSNPEGQLKEYVADLYQPSALKPIVLGLRQMPPKTDVVKVTFRSRQQSGRDGNGPWGATNLSILTFKRCAPPTEFEANHNICAASQAAVGIEEQREFVF